jgi:hypothetical protein
LLLLKILARFQCQSAGKIIFTFSRTMLHLELLFSKMHFYGLIIFISITSAIPLEDSPNTTVTVIPPPVVRKSIITLVSKQTSPSPPIDDLVLDNQETTNDTPPSPPNGSVTSNEELETLPNNNLTTSAEITTDEPRSLPNGSVTSNEESETPPNGKLPTSPKFCTVNLSDFRSCLKTAGGQSCILDSECRVVTINFDGSSPSGTSSCPKIDFNECQKTVSRFRENGYRAQCVLDPRNPCVAVPFVENF